MVRGYRMFQPHQNNNIGQNCWLVKVQEIAFKKKFTSFLNIFEWVALEVPSLPPGDLKVVNASGQP